MYDVRGCVNKSTSANIASCWRLATDDFTLYMWMLLLPILLKKKRIELLGGSRRDYGNLFY